MLLAGAAIFAVPLAANAGPALFVGSAGSRSASVNFDNLGGNLVLTLANTSSLDTMVPTDVLTAVFFTLSGSPTLTPLSALLASGSTVIGDPDGQPVGGVVGGEWGYRSDQGVSSSGLGIF